MSKMRAFYVMAKKIRDNRSDEDDTEMLHEQLT